MTDTTCITLCTVDTVKISIQDLFDNMSLILNKRVSGIRRDELNQKNMRENKENITTAFRYFQIRFYDVGHEQSG